MRGIEILKKVFNVFQVHGKENKELTEFISRKSPNSERSSAIIIRSGRKLNEKIINDLSRKTGIGLICTVSSGFDNVDIISCRNQNIDVMNVSGANSISAAEFTFALILSIFKGIIPADKEMKKGIFDNSGNRNKELKGKTIGIIGVGRVGSLVAEYAGVFGMEVLGNDINPKVRNKYKSIRFMSLKSLLKKSDIITLHVPLDSSTINIINSENIELIPGKSILINCSRGGTVNEPALIKRLNSGKLYYAGLDVFCSEPLVNKRILKLGNVILTPHLAGKTGESSERMAVLAAENIIKYYKNNQSSAELVN